MDSGSGRMLDIKGLRVHFDTLYGPVEALSSVDLQVDQGQIMGLVGESGCGKSVTSLVTIGLATCEVDEGSVKYEGKELIFNDSESNARVKDISDWITAAAILVVIFGSFWAILIDPIQGASIVTTSLAVAALSWISGFIARREFRSHQSFMRWVRGNEISMIFQEPMTALNPLYTVEKQISEVMRVHDRLVEAETPLYMRVAQALVSPATLIRNAFASRPMASMAVFSVFAFVIAAHKDGSADAAASTVAAPFVAIWDAALYLIFFGILGLMSSRYYSFSGHAALTSALPQIPLVAASALVVYLMLWMPFSALMGMLVICTLLALPMIMASDYLGLDPAHRRQVAGILEDVRIPNPASVVKMYPHELSGGMRQRVMIAMMMACEPKLLIADEPTTALDVTIQAQILKLMRDLRDQKGTAILLITHDLGVIAEMCDDVTVMYAGRVVEKAPVKELFANPLHAYTRGLMACTPSLDSVPKSVLPAIPGQVATPSEFVSGCRFCQRMGREGETLMIRPSMSEVSPGHWVEECPICLDVSKDRWV